MQLQWDIIHWGSGERQSGMERIPYLERQHLPGNVVIHFMSIQRMPLLPLLCLSVLQGCASGEPVDRRQELDFAEIARALGCGPDEIPFCVDADCEVTDYRCVDKKRALGMIGPGRRQ
jgi:hypothetical protein